MMDKYTTGRLWKNGLLVMGLSAGIGLVHWSNSFNLSAQEAKQPAAAATGLRGILAAQTPLGLTEDDFVSNLGETWGDWSKSTSALVTRLYEEEGLDVAGQKQVLTGLKTKLGTIDKALADPAYATIFDSLSQQHGRLSRRVSVAQAILDTLELNPATAQQARVASAQVAVEKAAKDLDAYLANIENSQPWRDFAKVGDVSKLTGNSVPVTVLATVQSRLTNVEKLPTEEQRNFLKRAAFTKYRESLDGYLALANAPAPQVNQEALRGELTKLVAALERYEENRSIADAKAARHSFAEVRKLAADGGDVMGAALSSSYFNYNLRVVASEAFLSKLMTESRTENGVVDDFILEAKVDGTQTTQTTVGIDLLPSGADARFALTLSGVSQTSTQGVTDQATIFTSGYHQFWARKVIGFDGDRFATNAATIDVQANNTTTGARTKVSGLPIFGGIADSYAMSEARNRRGASEAIAAGRLRDKVLPRFDSEVDATFGKYSQKIEGEVIPKMKDLGVFPSARSYRTSDTELFANTRMMESGELGGDSPRFTAISAKGAAIHMHESLINNVFDRLNLGGRSFTEEELGQEIANAAKALLGRDVKVGGGKSEKSDGTKFVFPKEDALRVRIENGAVTLVFRMGLKPADGDEIPTQEISVPITMSIEGSNLKLEAGQVTVLPVEAGGNPVVQRARAGVVQTKIQKALPTRTLDRHIDLKRDENVKVAMDISQVKANAGWLSFVIE